jgi:outer membrane murein-binding lipoprotein Lpp
MRRLVLVGVLTLGLVTGAVACGGGGDNDAQDGKGADVQELQSRVSQLRLEVQSLRREVGALRDELTGAAGSGDTTTTTAPPSTTSTSRA